MIRETEKPVLAFVHQAVGAGSRPRYKYFLVRLAGSNVFHLIHDMGNEGKLSSYTITTSSSQGQICPWPLVPICDSSLEVRTRSRRQICDSQFPVLIMWGSVQISVQPWEVDARDVLTLLHIWWRQWRADIWLDPSLTQFPPSISTKRACLLIPKSRQQMKTNELWKGGRELLHHRPYLKKTKRKDDLMNHLKLFSIYLSSNSA